MGQRKFFPRTDITFRTVTVTNSTTDFFFILNSEYQGPTNAAYKFSAK